MNDETIKKPSTFLHTTEIIRAAGDLVSGFFYLSTYRYIKSATPRPVLLVPGLINTDFSMILLRRFIRKHGYAAVYGWGLGRNWGNLDDIKTLSEKIEKIYDNHQQKITLIGWSLGGIYVRELAKQKPELVEQIITIGSPFAKPYAPNHATWIFNLLKRFDKIDKKLWAELPIPAPVRTTAIYSKQDGVVPWQACMELIEDDSHTNIEVNGSHFGFPVNPAVFKIVGERI